MRLHLLIVSGKHIRADNLSAVGFEALQRFFYFSLDRHYYYQLQIFNGMLAGTFAWEIIKNGGLQRMFCSIVAVRLFGL